MSSHSSSHAAAASAAAAPPPTRRRAHGSPAVPPVPPFHTGAIVHPVHHYRGSTAVVAASPALSPSSSPSPSPSPSPSGSLSTPSPPAVLTSLPTAHGALLSFSALAPPNGSTPGSNAAAFFAAFFCPLTFYKQLDIRAKGQPPLQPQLASDAECETGASSAAAGATAAGSSKLVSAPLRGPLFLARTLRYNAAEASAARRDARVRDALEQTRLAKAAANRARTAHARKRQRKTITASSAAAATAEGINTPSASAAVAVEPYISPSDLLGLKLAVLSSAAAATSSSPSSSSSSPSLASVVFDRHRVSKRLQISVEQVLFHGGGAATTSPSPSFGNISSSSSLLPSAFVPQSQSGAAANLGASPPSLSAVHFQHIHAAAPASFQAVAHLCSPAPPSSSAGSSSSNSSVSRVEAVLSARLDKERLAGQVLTGRSGVEYVLMSSTSDPLSATSPTSPATTASPATPRAHPASFMFNSVNFFTHPQAQASAIALASGSSPSIPSSSSRPSQRKFRNPVPLNSDDASSSSSSASTVASPWSVRLLLSPWNGGSSGGGGNGGTSGGGQKHSNKGPRIHAATASNNARSSDGLAETTQALLTNGGGGSDSHNTDAQHAQAQIPEALKPLLPPSVEELNPGQFMVQIPLLRSRRGGREEDMEWLEEGSFVTNILAAPTTSSASASFSSATMGLAPFSSSSSSSLVANPNGSSAASPTTAAAAGNESIVGTCVVRIRWVYKQHAAVTATSSSVPRPIPAAATAAAPPSIPVMLAWRYVYSVPTPAAGSSDVAGASVAASPLGSSSSSSPLSPLVGNKYFLEPSLPALAATSPVSVGLAVALAAAAAAGTGPAHPNALVAPTSSSPVASSSSSSAMQIEYRTDFSCTFCSLRGEDHSGGKRKPSAGVGGGVVLRDYQQLVRHLEASHSEFLSFQYGLPKRVQMDLLPEDPPAPLAPAPVATDASSSSSSTGAGAGEPSSGKDHHPPTEVLTHEIVVLVRESRAASLMALVAPTMSAALAASASGGGASNTNTDDLPQSFVEGVREAAKVAATAAVALTNNKVPSIAPVAAAAAAATMPSSSSATLTDTDTPQAYFSFFSERYSASPIFSSQSHPLHNSYARSALHHRTPMEEEELALALAEGGRRAAGLSAKSTGITTKLSEDTAHLAAHSASSPFSVKALTLAAFAKHSNKRDRDREHKHHHKRSRHHHHHHHHHSHGSSATTPGPGTGLSVAAAACLASNPALYSRQWFHASSGAPVALCELGYDSDSGTGGAGQGQAGGGVDEEWLIASAHKIIEEFEDVSAGEVAFMKVWNEFVLRRTNGGGGGAIYADYLYPSVCASFAKVCGPILRGVLRTGFLCHLLSGWEFGLLSFPEIEACMRILDQGDDDDDPSESADETRVAAGSSPRKMRRRKVPPHSSLHAPARGGAWRSARDEAGGMGVHERGESSGLMGASHAHAHGSQAHAAHSSSTHAPSPTALAPRALLQNGTSASSNGVAARGRSSSPAVSSSPSPTNAGSTGAAAASSSSSSVSFPPRSARLREREALDAIAAALEADRQKKRDSRSARDRGLRTMERQKEIQREAARALKHQGQHGGGGRGGKKSSGPRATDAMDTDSSGDGGGSDGNSSSRSISPTVYPPGTSRRSLAARTIAEGDEEAEEEEEEAAGAEQQQQDTERKVASAASSSSSFRPASSSSSSSARGANSPSPSKKAAATAVHAHARGERKHVHSKPTNDVSTTSARKNPSSPARGVVAAAAAAASSSPAGSKRRRSPGGGS